jgi:hypothetical protein
MRCTSDVPAVSGFGLASLSDSEAFPTKAVWVWVGGIGKGTSGRGQFYRLPHPRMHARPLAQVAVLVVVLQ